MIEKEGAKPKFRPNQIDTLLARFALDIAKERLTELAEGREYEPRGIQPDRLTARIVRAYDTNGSITCKEIYRFLELSGDGLHIKLTFPGKQKVQIYFADDSLLEKAKYG